MAEHRFEAFRIHKLRLHEHCTAHVGNGKHDNLGEKGRLACHLIVFFFVVLCVVSILRLKFISGVMHWRQVVSA